METILEISKMTWKESWSEFGIDRKVKELAEQYVSGMKLREISVIQPDNFAWNRRVDRLEEQCKTLEKMLQETEPKIADIMKLLMGIDHGI